MVSSVKRIAIIGSGGAGKSTLARRLGATLGVEVIHLDAVYWREGWNATPSPEWERTVAALVQRESWIMDGNFAGTLDTRCRAADTLIFLDVPRSVCFCRVLYRQLAYWGRTRPDMAPGCPEKLDAGFLQWIWRYPLYSRPRVLRKLEHYAAGRTVVKLRSSTEVKRFLKEIKARHSSPE